MATIVNTQRPTVIIDQADGDVLSAHLELNTASVELSDPAATAVSYSVFAQQASNDARAFSLASQEAAIEAEADREITAEHLGEVEYHLEAIELHRQVVEGLSGQVAEDRQNVQDNALDVINRHANVELVHGQIITLRAEVGVDAGQTVAHAAQVALDAQQSAEDRQAVAADRQIISEQRDQGALELTEIQQHREIIDGLAGEVQQHNDTVQSNADQVAADFIEVQSLRAEVAQDAAGLSSLRDDAEVFAGQAGQSAATAAQHSLDVTGMRDTVITLTDQASDDRLGIENDRVLAQMAAEEAGNAAFDVQIDRDQIEIWRGEVGANTASVSTATDQVLGWRNESEGFRDESEGYKNDAQAAAAAASGGLKPIGNWDASANTNPPAPTEGVAPWYRISVAGTVPAVGEVAVGDNIYWGVDAQTWFKIDNTEKFTSINGFTSGAVNLTATHVGAIPATKEGAGNGLHADLLDGQHGAYYLSWSNITGKPSPVLTLQGDVSGTTTFSELGSAIMEVAVQHNSHFHMIETVEGLEAALNARALTSNLGTAAGANVTTSTDSMSAGQLVKVGDYGNGLGLGLVESGHLNNYAVLGSKFVVLSTVGGYPWPDGSAAVIEVVGGSAEPGAGTHSINYRIVQRATEHGGSRRCAFRAWTGSAWTAWHEIWTTGNLVKTSSAKDHTTGRMLQVGDGGINSVAASGTTRNLLINEDLNGLRTSGLWHLSNPVNGPGGDGYIIVQNSANENWTAQIFISSLDANAGIWHRKRVNGTWSTWHQSWHSGNLTKTTGPTDATAGRMLQVGDFGVGSFGNYENSVDALLTRGSGFYSGNGSAADSNWPGASNYFPLLNLFRSSSTAAQITFDETGMYFRAKSGAGLVPAFSKVWHSGNFNPSSYLPYAGGTMTGSITFGSAGDSTYRFLRLYRGTNEVTFTTTGTELILQSSDTGSAASRYLSIAPTASAPKYYDGSALRDIWHAGTLEKTSSATDTTAGRVLTVGYYGLGSSAAPVAASNLNSVVESGFYALDTASVSNGPPELGGAAGYGEMIVVSRSPTRSTQQLFPLAPYSRMFFRTRSASAPNPWAEVWTTVNDSTLVKTTGDQTIGGIKTFTEEVNSSGGHSTSWGGGSGASGAFNANMGTASNATWLLTGTSGGTRRGGIQMLDNGSEVRLYATSVSMNFNNNGILSVPGYFSGSGSGLTNIPISGVSGLQSALDAAGTSITGGASTIVTSNLSASRALVSDGSGKVGVSAVTSTELSRLDGVTSNVQTQLNAKANSHGYYDTSWSKPAANFTFQLADAGRLVFWEAGTTNHTATIPNDSTVNFPVGTIIGLRSDANSDNPGRYITPAAGVQLKTSGSNASATRIIGSYYCCKLVKVGGNEWMWFPSQL